MPKGRPYIASVKAAVRHAYQVENVPPLGKRKAPIMELVEAKLKPNPGKIFIVFDGLNKLTAGSVVQRLRRITGVSATMRTIGKRTKVYAGYGVRTNR